MKSLHTTDYNNADQLDDLYDINIPEYPPVIVISQSRGMVYKIILCNGLKPQRQVMPNEKRSILPSNVLDSNDNVEPK